MLLKSYLITRLALYLPDQDNHSQFQGSVLQSKSTTSEGEGTKVQETFWFFCRTAKTTFKHSTDSFLCHRLSKTEVQIRARQSTQIKTRTFNPQVFLVSIVLFSTCDGTLSIEDIVMKLSCTDVSKVNSRKNVEQQI